jgi:hypothetical protein
VGRDFPHLSRPAPGPTQPPVQWVSGTSRGLRRPGRDADHTPPSSAAFKKELNYSSTHPKGPPGPVTGFPLPVVKRSLRNIRLYKYCLSCLPKCGHINSRLRKLVDVNDCQHKYLLEDC